MFLLPLPTAAYRPLLPSELRRLKSDRYAVIPNWLTPAEVDALRADALAVDAASGRECGVGVPSSGTNRRDQSVRRSRQCSLYPPPPVGAGSVELRQTFYDAVGALRDELQACEELALPELADFETELIYLLYPVGGHYMRHLDVPRAGDGWVPKGRRATDGGSLSGAASRHGMCDDACMPGQPSPESTRSMRSCSARAPSSPCSSPDPKAGSAASPERVSPGGRSGGIVPGEK